MCEFCSINNLLKIVDSQEFRGYQCIGCGRKYHLGHFDKPSQELSRLAQIQELLSCPRGGCVN